MYMLNDIDLDMQRVQVAERKAQAEREQHSALAGRKPWWRRRTRDRAARYARS